MATWDPVAVKALLRLTTQRLGQLQEKMDSQGQSTRKDIANLLQERNVALARAKSQNLIHEDTVADLLEALEMCVGLVVEHFAEIQNETPGPTVVEAASSIIFAAPHTESKDLNTVRELLMQRLGPDFSRSAISNHDYRVSQRVARALSAPPPSAANLSEYMSAIANAHGVNWTPELQRHDILDVLSDILDPTTSPVVDLPLLRRLCSQGIPDDPPWMRPRIWKLFYGVLPTLKSSWDIDIHKQRESYYDLVRRLLFPFSSLPPPTNPLAPSDLTLLNISTSLSRVPHNLFSGLQDEPRTYPLSLLDASAPDDIRIDCASNLDLRLKMIEDSQNSADSIRGITPEIPLERHTSPVRETLAGRRPGAPTTLLSAKGYIMSAAHQKHTSALLRLLYLHSCLNPMNQSPHIPFLLVPLYSVIIQETDPKDAAHVEADTFWVFEAMIGEFSELEDEEGGNVWMMKLSERLAWADEKLSANLHAKGLDPALPHYSYRWLAPLLTQTLPLSSVYLVWDALFSCPMRERDTNAKLEHLLNVCSSMLTRARAPLFRLGKPGHKPQGLWGEEYASHPPPSPLRPWQLNDAFLEGMSLLQFYPVEAAGGIDIILQTASDMAQRREEEKKLAKVGTLGLGARLRVTMWKGFTNQLSSSLSNEGMEEDSESEALQDDGNWTETQQEDSSPSITSRLANSVWRGITNQSSMEVPPSPLTPSTPPSLPHPSSPATFPSINLNSETVSSSTPSVPNIWEYAEKLKDSDAAASFAKVSSNWRAKALDAWSARKKNVDHPETPSPTSTASELPPSAAAWNSWNRSPMIEAEAEDRRRESLPGIDRSDVYSPPPRPAFFRPPRDSFMPTATSSTSSPTSPNMSPQSDSGILHRTKASLASITGLSPTTAPVPPPKQGPRPLMLNSSHLMTALKSTHIPRSATSAPTRYHNQWSEVMRSKGHDTHKNSHSSISSLSPSDALGRTVWRGSRSDAEYDPGKSRLVPINRRSVSPMAPGHRMSEERPPSTGSSSDMATQLAPQGESHSEKWLGRVNSPDSPPVSASPDPHTPFTDPSLENGNVHIASGEDQRLGSVTSSDPNIRPSEVPPRKITRKKTPLGHPTVRTEDVSDSSISVVPSLSPRIRSKRYPQRPSILRSRSRSDVVPDKILSPNALSPDGADEQEVAVLTPRASTFDISESSSASPTSPQLPRRSRKVSTDGHDTRVIKMTVERPRIRKISIETRDVRGKRESAANEGDDEGYGDLLSAYESED